VDGNATGTRWSSVYTGLANPDAEWFAVDLGAVYSIKEVVIKWENAYGKEYLIQVSSDNVSWTTIYHKTGGTNSPHDLTGLSGAGRYVRMQGIKRGSGYGYSIWEFQVFGCGTEQATAILSPASQHTWQVVAVDGAGNATTNSNAPFTIIPQLTPLQQWRQAHFGTIDSNDSVAGDTAMPKRDGIANLIKYALGLDPAAPAVSGLPLPGNVAGALTLRFNRQKIATDITYRVEASNDLATWTEIWNSANNPYGGGGNAFELVTVSDPVPMSSAPNHRRFIRLRVSRP
jgi:hypothetical protein